jgi:cyclophilin family peptidyl-prolyl cis-trans isomerase
VVSDSLGVAPSVVNAGVGTPAAATAAVREPAVVNEGAAEVEAVVDAEAAVDAEADGAVANDGEAAAPGEEAPPVEVDEAAEVGAEDGVDAAGETAAEAPAVVDALADVDLEPAPVEAVASTPEVVEVAEVRQPPADADPVQAALLVNNAEVPEGYVALPYLSVERRLAFEAPETVIDPEREYLAILETNRGDIVIELLAEAAPRTVNNFIFLALHKYYDGIVFHRVIEGFMAQTGDPTGSGTGGPGYTFADEFTSGLTHSDPGIVSMANAGPGTNGSQFFITFAATPWLDNAHTIFGRVIEGSDVLDSITRVDPTQPSAVAFLDDLAQVVRDQGINLVGDGTVIDALSNILGVQPEPGGRYDIAGASVAIGSMAGQPAAGFFPFPDRMIKVTIATVQ